MELPMEELVTLITQKTGLDKARAEKALGIMLTLVKNQGDKQKVEELFAKLPGAAELAAKHGGDGAAKGGLLGMLGGGLMGGPLAAIGKLQAAGLNMDQIKVLGTTTLDYAKQKAGADLVRQVAGSIPGLSGYV
jgi:predicted lipid-binding transport protein (Tim44 family)